VENCLLTFGSSIGKKALLMKNTTSLLLFLLISCVGFSQGWYRLYETYEAFDAIQTPDGDYLILSGGNLSLSNSIIRTDETGIKKWIRNLPPGVNSTKMFPLPSGNIALLSNDHRVIEIDTAANLVSANPIPASFPLHPHVFPVADGYISMAYSSALQMWKIDLTGNLVWENEVFTSHFFPGGRGTASQDGGFVFAGGTHAGLQLMKFDAFGNLEWTAEDDSILGTSIETVDVVATTDGGYGVATSTGSFNSNLHVFRFDSNVNLLWQGEVMLFGQPSEFTTAWGSAHLNEIIETPDGGIAIAGRLSDLLAIHEYPMVVKFDQPGTIGFLYVSPQPGSFENVLRTNDGGYYAIGQMLTGNLPFGGSQAHAVKRIATGSVFPNTIEGKVALDEDLDCLVSAPDLPLAGWVVRATGVSIHHGVTNSNGNYYIGVDTGAYTLEIFPPNNLWSPCENQVMVNLSGVNQIISAHFPVQATIECPAMQVDITTPFLRRCFNNTFYVKYCNRGTTPGEAATVEVTLDSLLELVSSSIPHSGQVGNTYSFPVGDIDIGECGNFYIATLVRCEAELGQALCVEAHVFPDTICGFPFNWSGASMVARAICQGDTTVVLELENVGTSPTSEPMDYIVIEDQIIFLQESQVFEPMQVETILLTANGSTWRIISEQEPNHPGYFIPTAFVEGCGTNEINTFSTGFVNEHPMADGNPYLDIDCEVVIGAFDPNDKMGLPKGYGDQHYIEPNTDLEYRIRFQNTGTDTAFTVVIRDTLSPFLDPATLRAGAASHNYEFDLEGDAVAIFRFENILLPDSNVNEALSHGFVNFRIFQKPDVALESVIENEAAIFFDFNDPIITNSVFHTIGRNFIEIVNDIQKLPKGLGALLSYPNPSAGAVTFEIPSEQPIKATFVLYDQFGRLVLRKGFEGKRFQFNGYDYSKGIYFYKVEVEGLGMYSGKVILK